MGRSRHSVRKGEGGGGVSDERINMQRIKRAIFEDNGGKWFYNCQGMIGGPYKTEIDCTRALLLSALDTILAQDKVIKDLTK